MGGVAVTKDLPNWLGQNVQAIDPVILAPSAPSVLGSEGRRGPGHATGKRGDARWPEALRSIAQLSPAVVRERWTCTYTDRRQRPSWHTCFPPSAKPQNREAVLSPQRQ